MVGPGSSPPSSDVASRAGMSPRPTRVGPALEPEGDIVKPLTFPLLLLNETAFRLASAKGVNS